MRVAHEEFWSVVDLQAVKEVITLDFKLTGPGIPAQLGALAKVYDRYIINSLSLHYHPSCGTTTNGALTIAVDWDPNDTGPTLSKCKAMWPQIRTPVWQTASLKLPAKRLMDKKQIHTDMKQPFAIQIAMAKVPATAVATVGELYLRYDITFLGVSGN